MMMFDGKGLETAGTLTPRGLTSGELILTFGGPSDIERQFEEQLCSV